jgi:hypothetical protein
MFLLSSRPRNCYMVWCINDISLQKLDWQLWYVAVLPLIILSLSLPTLLDVEATWRRRSEGREEEVQAGKPHEGKQELTSRWRNTIKVISELAPEYSVTQLTSYLVEEPIYLVWILLNCIVLIVEISILHLVVNMLLLMVSPWSLRLVSQSLPEYLVRCEVAVIRVVTTR